MSATLQGRTVIYTQPIGVNENLSRVILDLAHSVAAPLPTPTPGTPWDCLPQVGAARLIATVREHGQLAFGQITLTPTQVWAGSGAHNLTSLPELREHVRQQPHFRSLATCADLPLDWHIAITPAQLPAVVETVYPGVLAAWAGNAPVQPLERVIARQTGMFQALADFAQTADSITQICAHCILQPAWQTAADQPFPCTMPCNHGLSHALERIQEA
jgi:sirohydrochlorin ferrochelatase